MSKNNDEMLKALAAYRGPVTKCRTGGAYGAGDLRTWAMRRADGQSGVPSHKVLRQIKKQTRKAKKKTRQYQQYKAAGADQYMTFERWLSQKPSVRRAMLAEQKQKEAAEAKANGQVIWGDSWDDSDTSEPPPWE